MDQYSRPTGRLSIRGHRWRSADLTLFRWNRPVLADDSLHQAFTQRSLSAK